jgi:hypothetical protein
MSPHCFLFDLSYGAVDCIASNVRTTDERRIVNLQESGGGPLETESRYLPGGAEEYREDAAEI